MERLTHRYTDGEAWASIYKVCACGEYECKGPIIDRLAAYEDTGLEPGDISAIQRREQGLSELLVNISCGCAVTYTRLAELARAEKDGRLAVLPCKPGTELFTHCHVRGANQIAHSYFYPPYIPTLGKNAWLTREEAEAALKKRERGAK